MKESRYLRTAGETAILFKIKESTLRKYAVALEKEGYAFTKNKQGHRAFTDDDITMIRRFISAKNAPSMTIERAARAVMYDVEPNDVHVFAMDDKAQQRSYIEGMSHDEMKDFVHKQMEFNQEIMKRLDRQENRESEREERIRGRDQQLTDTLNEIKETKRLIAAEQEKKPFWKRWINK